jgi:hypothetical protein
MSRRTVAGAQRGILYGLCVSLCWAGPAARAEEDIAFSLFKNPGFEGAAQPAVKGQGKQARLHLDGWNIAFGWGDYEVEQVKQKIEVRSDGAKDGKQYLRVRNPQKEKFLGLAQEVQWEAGAAYKLSFWSRGPGKGGCNIRLRIENYGGPADAKDLPATELAGKDGGWAYHEYSFLASVSRGGYLSLWCWEGESVDLDNVMLRKSFWSTDKKLNATEPGQPIALKLSMKSEAPQTVGGSYQVLAPDGKELQAGKIEGATPLQKDFPFTPAKPGYYTVRSSLKTAKGSFEDSVGVVVVAAEGGLEGLEAFRRAAGR